MSLNPQALSPNLNDVLEGTVTNFFSRQENSLLQNELINGQYRMVTAGCYAGNPPIKSPGFTHVCISTNGSTIADIDNCFITANLEYTLSFVDDIAPPAAPQAQAPRTSFANEIFIGFKQSLEALERYDIVVSSQILYSQPFVGPESTILNAGINDLIRSNNPYVYTTWNNVWLTSSNMCGTYVSFPAGLPAGTPFKVTIPIKINLHQFLVLSGIKYLPAFAGRWEIQLYFGSKNLIVANTGPPTGQNQHILQQLMVNSATLDFRQINEEIKLATDVNVANPAVTTVTTKLQCSDCIAQEVYINITQFQLRYEVYEALRAHYAERPWIIPTNLLQYSRFSGQPADWFGGQSYHCTLSQSLENCDSLFILIPQSTHQQTCYYNPYLNNVRMSLGEFGIHPARYVNTHDDPRFLNMVLDSLNLSESTISSMNKDVARSIISSREFQQIGENGATTKIRGGDFGDKSNFFIGISLSNNGFQNGCVNSPNTSIPFLFDATFDEPLVREFWKKAHDTYPSIDSSIVCLFLIDAAIMIQVIPGSDIPGVKLTSKSIV